MFSNVISQFRILVIINVEISWADYYFCKKKGDAFLKEVYYEPRIIIATLK